MPDPGEEVSKIDTIDSTVRYYLDDETVSFYRD